MASSCGNDTTWKYTTVIEGNRNGTKCIFCESIFRSGEIRRLKSHLADYDPHKSVKKCEKVSANIKHEVIAWIKKKECIKQEDTMYGRKTRGANDDQDVASVALSFESISLDSGTGTSNESQEGNNQYDYNVYGSNQCAEVCDQSSS
ncbi:hypothetical protein ACLB2K_045140 [Fragaria x ananassa]